MNYKLVILVLYVELNMRIINLSIFVPFKYLFELNVWGGVLNFDVWLILTNLKYLNFQIRYVSNFDTSPYLKSVIRFFILRNFSQTVYFNLN